jgi:hypothetical protein
MLKAVAETASRELLRFPRAEVTSDVATQAPSESFHTVRKFLFIKKSIQENEAAGATAAPVAIDKRSAESTHRVSRFAV